MLEQTWQDIRYGLRLLRRSPLFTATALLSLAIGIGANTTIFSFVSALLLRPMPGIVEPERLVDIGRSQDGRGFDNSSYPNYRDVRERATLLSDLYAYSFDVQPVSLGDATDAERIFGMPVSGAYFHALGVTPALGRFFTVRDDRLDGPPVAVISYELWQRRFGGADDIVGRVVRFNTKPVVVIGIAPPGFQGTTLLRPDAWMPMEQMSVLRPGFGADMFRQRQATWLVMGGRLKPGVTVAQADAEIRAIGETLRQSYPEDNRGKGLRVSRSAAVPGHTDLVVGFLGVLLAIVGLVLLAACVNFAGMLLARATGRGREIAVRLAIGARRGRLVRQLITETAILFLASGAVALVLTRVLTRLLLAVLPALPVPVLVDVSVDWRVAICGVGLSLAAAILSGLAPALQASRPDLVAALKTDTVGAGARQRLRHAFIVAQVAVSLALVIAGALLIRALGRAATIDPGFTQTGVDVVTLDLSLSGYGQADALAFASRAIARVRALPGVDAAAWVADLPLDDGRMGFGILKVPGRQGPDENGSFPADWNAVTPGVFRTLDLRLEHGRDFTDADTASAPRVIIVNEAMARSVWGTVDVIGRQFEDEQQHTLTIVGVADDARLVDLGRPSEPYVYVPLSQRYTSRVSLLVKSARDGMIPQLRTALRDLNPALPATTAMPLEQVTAVMFVPQRIAAAVAGTLGVFVLLLAAIGIYGVVAYSVGRRMREIGIRMALGADPEAIVRLLVRQSMVMTALGILVGLFAGAAAAQILRSLLFGIPPLDPIAFGGAASLFAIVSVAASYLPARRALRVDPMIALRSE